MIILITFKFLKDLMDIADQPPMALSCRGDGSAKHPRLVHKTRNGSREADNGLADFLLLSVRMPLTPSRGRVLILATQAADALPYTAAANKLGVVAVLGTENGGQPSLSLNFAQRESALEIVQYALEHPLSAIVAVDEAAAPACARAASMMGLRWHPPRAADACADKSVLRQKLSGAGITTSRLETAPDVRQIGVAAIYQLGKLRVLGVVPPKPEPAAGLNLVFETVRRAAHAAGLSYGPLSARLDVAGENISMVDLAPVIPVAYEVQLQFRIPLVDDHVSLSEVVLRHALGMDISRVYRAMAADNAS
jgi:hypothetical protein